MLLGSIPPKLDRQHEKAWVLLTSPTCTQLIYSIQSHSRLTNFLSSSLPPSSPLSCPRLHRMIFTAKYVRVRLTNIRCFFVTYVTQLAYGLPPLTPYSHPTWNLEMSLMHSAPPLTSDSHTTPLPSFPYSQFRL